MIRKNAFWLLDSLKGGKIRNNLVDIQDTFNTTDFDKIQRKTQPVLVNLLNTVANTTSFYAGYKNFKVLQDFPVINKSIIKSNFDAINIIKDTSKLLSVRTSGSTGTPFRIYQTKEKKTRNTADTLFFGSLAGFSLGDKLLYQRLWSAYYKKPEILARLQNICQLDIADLNDQYIQKLCRQLEKDKSRKGWLGYSSAFERICNYLDSINSAPLDCNIGSIIAMSEALPEHVGKRMQYYFQCPVVSRYSNVENGMIAQQAPGNQNFTINWASYIVEVLDMDNDVPVEIGSLGRIVITDLYNLATPMIRYDTGDIGSLVIEKKKNHNLPMFKTIYGRRADIIRNTEGEVLSPFVVSSVLKEYQELNQFQLVQKSTFDFVFKINARSNFNRQEEFIASIRLLLGEKAVIHIAYVNEIPLLKSGKRKIFVNLTTQNT